MIAAPVALGAAEVAVSAKGDAELLLDSVLPLAKKMLAESGEFFPYGGALTREGKTVSVAGDPGLGNRPPSERVIDTLERGLKAGVRSGSYRAVAIVVDVRVLPAGAKKRTDAIEVRLEHAEGYCVNYYQPYQRSRDGVQFGEPFATQRTGTVFSACR
jgi:hypothetical protein